jgi:hypothetical protein
VNVEPAGLRRVVVTLDLADGPHIDVLAVPALLRLSEWMHHEEIAPARTALEITGPALPTTT